jgi:hypothetical protein
VNTSVPIICAACGCKCGSTVFYEDDRPYHHGCRPSQRLQRLNAETNRWVEDWGDAQKRIAELEAAERKAKAHAAQLDSLLEQAEAELRTMTGRNLKAEAELAAVKARRCKNCGSWHRCWIYDASVSGYGEYRPDDVWCESWAQRETG